MKGFKATNANMQCQGFQFELGKEYEISGDLELCSNGFHFCEKFFDVYSYYPKSEDTRVFEVEALGAIVGEGDKHATSKIRLVREIIGKELLGLWIKRTNSGDGNSGDWNSGDGNSGNRNSGDGNSGDWNSGDWNSGDGNSGNRNSGYGNSGYGNSGDGNSGNRNSGNRNSGYGNSGNRNSGDWNSGDGNSGYFNTAVPLYFFNKPSDMAYSYDLEHRMRNLNVKPILTWIDSSNMTEKEKNDHPSHKTTGGFLRKTDRHDWSRLTDDDKKFIKSLPNFDNDIFKQISGVTL
jgi:hypothetical protein